jgi:hypothetical protein
LDNFTEGWTHPELKIIAMEKSYKYLNYFFASMLGIIFIGFFNSYFSLFPRFQGLPDMAHLHAIGLLLWFSLLIAQPLLIRYDKLPVHRALGKFSYFLILYILFTIVGMIRHSYSIYHVHYLVTSQPPGLYFSMLGATSFTLFYILAIIYRKNTPYHMRYIIGSSLALLPPATDRFFREGLGMGVHGAPFTPLILMGTIIGLIVYDKVKLGKVYIPYIVILVYNILTGISIGVIPRTAAWHSFALWIGGYL